MGLTEKVIGEKENAADGCGGDALPGVLQWMSRWKGRHQKCSCCRRNANLKDCYEADQNTRAPILSAEEMEILNG